MIVVNRLHGAVRFAHMSSPSISIVIRALNEAQHLPALFSGLLRQTVQPDEVILVDSGSSDDSIAIARAHGARIVTIQSDKFSFGRALNIGCEAATGEILVFVSAHVYPFDELWLEKLVAPFDTPNTALVYGRQTGDASSKFSEIQLMRKWFPTDSVDDQQHPFCNNANCAVRKSWWEKHRYDEALTGLEDLDWANRVMIEGGRISYRSDAMIVHKHDEDWGRTRNRYRREAIALRRIFPEQKMTLMKAVQLFFVSVVRDYVAAIPQHQSLRNLTSIPTFRSAQYLGAWEGFRTTGELTRELHRRFYYPKTLRISDWSDR